MAIIYQISSTGALYVIVFKTSLLNLQKLGLYIVEQCLKQISYIYIGVALLQYIGDNKMAYVLKIVFYLSQYVIKVNNSGVKYFNLNWCSA